MIMKKVEETELESVGLKTYTENIELLDNEGRLTSNATILTLAEQEMKIKKERLL